MSFGVPNLKQKIDKVLVTNYVRKESSTFDENSANKLELTTIDQSTNDSQLPKLHLSSKAHVGALSTGLIIRCLGSRTLRSPPGKNDHRR